MDEQDTKQRRHTRIQATVDELTDYLNREQPTTRDMAWLMCLHGITESARQLRLAAHACAQPPDLNTMAASLEELGNEVSRLGEQDSG